MLLVIESSVVLVVLLISCLVSSSAVTLSSYPDTLLVATLKAAFSRAEELAKVPLPSRGVRFTLAVLALDVMVIYVLEAVAVPGSASAVFGSIVIG